MSRYSTPSWHDIVLQPSIPPGLAPPACPEQAPPPPPSLLLRGDDLRRSFSPASSEEPRSKHGVQEQIDGVPMGIARTVVNMQQYYTSELGELACKLSSVTEELGRTQEENKVMQKRLDMHLVLLQGAVDFMEQVKGGQFDGGMLVAKQEMESTPPGGVYQEKAEDIRPRIQSSAPVRNSFDTSQRSQQQQQAEETSSRTTMLPTPPRAALASSTASTAPENDLDNLPPTPPLDKGPVRSTGHRAPKRRARAASSPPKKASKRRSVAPRRLAYADGDVKVERRPLTRPPLPLRLATEPRDRCSRNKDRDSRRASQRRGTRSIRTSTTAWAAVDMELEQGDEEEEEEDDDDLPFHNDAGSDYQPEKNAESDDSDADDDDDDGGGGGGILNQSHHHLPPLQTQASIPLSSVPFRSSPNNNNNNNNNHPPSSHRPPRYSTPRRTTTPRYASGPPERPFRFHRMGRTVADVWREYKLGAHGNPAIEALEEKYGTGWRTGSLRDVKYASNYVGVRQKVVSKVEDMCENGAITPEEACRRLDERVDGRMQMLITAVRRGHDPFKVIARR